MSSEPRTPVEKLILFSESAEEAGTWLGEIRGRVQEGAVRAVARRRLTPAGGYAPTGGGFQRVGPDPNRSQERMLTEVWLGRTESIDDAHGVVETVAMPPEPDAGGIVRVGLVRRNRALSRSEFLAHWRDVHGPLVMSLEPLFVGYVQNVYVDPATHWDGVVHQWYPSREAADDHAGAAIGVKESVAEDLVLLISELALFNSIDIEWPIRSPEPPDRRS